MRVRNGGSAGALRDFDENAQRGMERVMNSRNSRFPARITPQIWCSGDGSECPTISYFMTIRHTQIHKRTDRTAKNGAVVRSSASRVRSARGPILTLAAHSPTNLSTGDLNAACGPFRCQILGSGEGTNELKRGQDRFFTRLVRSQWSVVRRRTACDGIATTDFQRLTTNYGLP